MCTLRRCKSAPNLNKYQNVDIVLVYNFNAITIVFFISEIKIIKLRQTPFIYNTDVYICDILHFNISNVVFIEASNHFYLLSGSWCQKFEMLTLCPTIDLLKPISRGFNTVLRTTIVLDFESLGSGFSFYHANITPYTYFTNHHTYTDTKVMTK